MQIEYLKTQYDFELQMVKENCNNRLKLMKENLENTHRHFEEEKDVLNKQIDLVEKEKFDLMQLNRKKCEDVQKECNFEIEKIKEIQKKSLENLKYEHDLTIKRIKELKENEIDAAMTASSHTRTIETVLNSIQENTKNIDGLSQKVQINHMVNLTDKEAEIKIKEENLKCKTIFI
jgi:Fas-binding factor 1